MTMNENCNCGCGGHHHHADEESKYEFVLNEYSQTMSDEEVAAKVNKLIDEKVEEKTEKRADDVLRAEDILTVEARDVIETDEDRENSLWFELRNAHRARRILTGRMDALERSPSGDYLVVVYLMRTDSTSCTRRLMSRSTSTLLS